MKTEPDEVFLALHSTITEIGALEWDRCAGRDNPFVSYGFLSLLEQSKSVGSGTGWLPQHAVFREKDGEIAAVVPMYVKLHSWGEYVFDQAWADAFENAGGSYYPKLVVGVPFSPVPGPRLLCAPGQSMDRKALGDALINLCRQLKMSSVHINFTDLITWKELGAQDWLQRFGIQYHWTNEGYKSFDDFLARLSSSHRKSIKRERRDAQNAGLAFQTLRGHQITPQHWKSFYGFYTATVDRKWGSAYLTEDFFEGLSERLGDAVVLMTAQHGDKLVAGALNLLGSETLYGRNWGCVGEWPFLHFELCYYRAIDFAIEHGIKTVEAGAQGSHKIQRGYLPQKTYSLHWIAHKGLSGAVKNFLTEERAQLSAQMVGLSEFSPFKAIIPE